MSKQKKFWAALSDYQHQSAEDKEKTDKRLWNTYGTEAAVLIVDMSGFTVHSDRHGIIHYLSMINRMQTMVSESISFYKGTIVKFFADNCMAVFDSPVDAFNFAVALNQQCEADNTSDEFAIHLSCGIDFGHVLMPGKQDCFGQAVNHASKLGEDIGDDGQILFTQIVANLLPDDINAEQKTITISDIEMTYYTVEYSACQVQ